MKKIIIILIGAIFIGLIGLGIYLIAKDKNNLKTTSEYYVELTGLELEQKIAAKESFVLLITQTGCNHCESFKPKYIGVLDEYKVTGYSINRSTLTDEEYAFLKDLARIDGTPATIFIVDGKEETVLNRIEGDRARNFIVSRFKSLGYIK